MQGLMVSVSGIRGIVGQGLTAETALRYAQAFGTALNGGKVVVGRDSRISGRMLRQAVIAGLLETGCEVVHLGIVSTPTIGVMVKERRAAGGIQITASHNPAPWNGLKLFGSDGAVLTADAGQRVQDIYAAGKYRCCDWKTVGISGDDSEAEKIHAKRVLGLIDPRAIAKLKIPVLLDGNGGAGGPLGCALLKALGCMVTPYHCEADGQFYHEPEPIPAHLELVASEVMKKPGTIGFALDPDADRLALIDEWGHCLSEELTLALAVRSRLLSQRGPVVINMSTSRVVEDVCKEVGGYCLRAPVGEANVVAAMKDASAVIGGEGNGGVIDPRVGWVRDPFAGMTLILHLLSATNKRLGELAADLPKYHMLKEKYELPRALLPKAYQALQARWPAAVENLTDGLRLEWPDRWLHLRGSNTEPIVRVIAEAGTAKETADLCQDAGEILRLVNDK